MRGFEYVVAFAVIVAMLFARGAFAQDTNTAGAEQRARALFEDGVARTERGDLAGAVDVFRLSWATYPRPRTMYNLAVLLDQLDRGDECLRAVDAFLGASDPVRDAERRVRVEAIREHRRTGAAATDADATSESGIGAALARIVVLQGIDRAEPIAGALFGPLPRARTVVASGVVVTAKGLVVTTRSAVEHARTHDDVVAVVIGEVAYSATVLGVHPSRDLAIVELRTTSDFAFAPLDAVHAVERDARVTSLGAPITGAAVERSDGRVTSVRTDGTYEVSLESLPATRGAIILDGHGALIGLASQLLEGAPGGAGRALVEPALALREIVTSVHPAFGAQSAASVAAARAAVELAEPAPSRDPVLTEERVSSAEMLAASPIPPQEAAAVCAASFRVLDDAISAAHVTAPVALPGTTRDRAVRLERAARALCNAARTAGLAEPFVTTVQSVSGGFSGSGTPIPVGATSHSLFPEAEPPPQPPHSAWELGVAGMLLLDDDRYAQGVGGGAQAYLWLTLGNWFDSDPVLVSVLMGASAEVGSYRSALMTRVSLEAGLRVELGGRALAATTFALFTPSYVTAEGRSDLSAASYRVGAGVRIGDVHVTLSFSEQGRGANDTLHAVSLGVALAL